MLKQIQDRLDALQVHQTSVAPYTHNKPSFSNQQRYNVDPNQQFSSTWQNTNNQRRWSNGRGFSAGRGGGGRGRGWSRSSGSAVSFGRGRGTFTPQQQETFEGKQRPDERVSTEARSKRESFAKGACTLKRAISWMFFLTLLVGLMPSNAADYTDKEKSLPSLPRNESTRSSSAEGQRGGTI